MAEKSQSADEDMSAHGLETEKTAVPASEQKANGGGTSKGPPNVSASEEQNGQDQRDAPAPEPELGAVGEAPSYPTVAAAEMPPASETNLDAGKNTRSDGRPHEAAAQPMSAFYVDIPWSTKSSQEPWSSNVGPETTGIPEVTPVETATTIDIYRVPSSQQPRRPRSGGASTQDLLPAVRTAAPHSVLEVSPAVASGEATVDDTGAQGQDDAEAEKTQALADESKRKVFLESTRTDLSQHDRFTTRPGADSWDEEAVEELRSAKMQEVKPMLVAKTPISPAFSTSPMKGRATLSAHMVRTISNPVRGNLAVPIDVSQPSARSISTGAAYSHHQVTQQQGKNQAKKPNMGSSISQRIRALEKLTAASGDAGAPVVRERPSSIFFTVKRREPSRSPSVLDRANSFRNPTPEPHPRSNGSSTEEEAGRRNMMEESNNSGDSPPAAERGRPESVSVTAKIIRDPTQMSVGLEPPKDPSEYCRLDLKQSTLLVDHQKAVPGTTQAAVEPASERRSGSLERVKSTKSRQSSLSIVKDFIKERRKSVTSTHGDILAAPRSANPSRSPSRGPSAHNSSSHPPRLSMSSRRSSLTRDCESVVVPTGESFGEDGSANENKKLSRAGRFMRRLSILSGSRSKNLSSGISSTVAEEENPERTAARPATARTPGIVSYMGDVNVQFPDNLLWKRRHMCLDSQGFLILSTLPAQSGRQAQGVKRYHLSEFRTPYAPDVEVQELPNSVVLDFIEGTSIQVACEDRTGQMSVLSILQQAYATRGSTYGL